MKERVEDKSTAIIELTATTAPTTIRETSFEPMSMTSASKTTAILQSTELQEIDESFDTNSTVNSTVCTEHDQHSIYDYLIYSINSKCLFGSFLFGGIIIIIIIILIFIIFFLIKRLYRLKELNRNRANQMYETFLRWQRERENSAQH